MSSLLIWLLSRYHKSTITTLKFISVDDSTQTFQNHYIQVPRGPRGPEGPRGYSFYGSQYVQSIPGIPGIFRGSRNAQPIPNTLPGPGIFYAPRRGVSKQACFQNYLVNVSVRGNVYCVVVA